MIHEQITKRILGACFNVSNELGCGFLESVYERAMMIALQEEGLKATCQVPLKVMFRKQVVGDFCPDIIVEDEIIVELKAVKALAPEHVAQVLNYLKASGLKVGLLVNFGKSKLEYRRLNNQFLI